jgi:hypothetical protein
MAAYQSQAVEPCVVPVAGMRPLAALEELLPGDLFIALAAHSGRPEVLTAWPDPSVTDESDPVSADPALDPFNPDNGPPYVLPAPLPCRAARPQRAHHRLGAWPAGSAARDPSQGPAIHHLPQLGRSADDRPVDRAVGPAPELVLSRRTGQGQLRRVRRRPTEHAFTVNRQVLVMAGGSCLSAGPWPGASDRLIVLLVTVLALAHRAAASALIYRISGQ